MVVISPHLSKNLSRADERALEIGHQARHVFGKHNHVRIVSLDLIEDALRKARDEYAIRSEKVQVIEEAVGNFEAIRHICNGAPLELNDCLTRLEAETAQRDRLALAIQGLERAVAWRKEALPRG